MSIPTRSPRLNPISTRIQLTAAALIMVGAVAGTIVLAARDVLPYWSLCWTLPLAVVIAYAVEVLIYSAILWGAHRYAHAPARRVLSGKPYNATDVINQLEQRLPWVLVKGDTGRGHEIVTGAVRHMGADAVGPLLRVYARETERYYATQQYAPSITFHLLRTAIAHAGDAAASHLISLLNDDNRIVREKAVIELVWHIGTVNVPDDAIPALVKAVETMPEANHIAALLKVLRDLQHDPAVVDLLRRYSTHTDPDVRGAAIAVRLNAPDGVAEIVGQLQGDDVADDFYWTAFEQLFNVARKRPLRLKKHAKWVYVEPTETVREAYRTALPTVKDDVIHTALQMGLALMNDREQVPSLTTLVHDTAQNDALPTTDKKSLRQYALETLGSVALANDAVQLIDLLDDPNVADDTAEALRLLKHWPVVLELVARFDTDPDFAKRALIKLNNTDARTPLSDRRKAAMETLASTPPGTPEAERLSAQIDAMNETYDWLWAEYQRKIAEDFYD